MDTEQLLVQLTTEHECSYIPNETAQTLFIAPHQELDRSRYSALSNIGFRRSGAYIYKPHCPSCQQCISVRVPVMDFVLSRSKRRTQTKNQDLVFEELESITNDELYQLYDRYISVRHADGDMYPPNREQYEEFLQNAYGNTRYFKLGHEDNTIAILVCDVLEDGVSAVYTFFDPDYHDRSLGKYAILRQIELAKLLNLQYVYLGYWVKACEKMSYKINFRPIELLIDGKWIRMN